MTLAVEAVFEDGVLKPLDPLNLKEHQKVRLVVETAVFSSSTPKQWHWKQAQAMDDQYIGDAAEELVRQRREG